VKAAYAGQAEFVLQAEQHGTGHAVMMAEPKLRDFEGEILVLYGDTPLLRGETIERMRKFKHARSADLVILTAEGDIPGRIVRDSKGRVERIVEAQDASLEELSIPERNTGVYLISAPLLWEGLGVIERDNRQGELYLTDVVGHAVQTDRRVDALRLEDADECLGINTRAELADAGRIMRARINASHMKAGVTLVDPESSYIDSNVEIGSDTLIEPGCTITGRSVIGSGVHIKAGCYIEESRLDDGVVFGPYSHLRPNSHLMDGVKIGNFVEVKNATLGRGSKAAHLTYIGDATVGEGVNFGCGSIVVNYDGYKKHHTLVGDGSFVGCNVNLIAPVEIGPNAFLAAGSTINRPVPEDSLGVARSRQQNLDGWVARKEGRSSKGTPAASGVTKTAGPKTRAPKKTAKKKTAKKTAAKRKTAKKTAKKAAKKAAKKVAKRKAAKKKSSRKSASKQRASTAGKKRVASRKTAKKRSAGGRGKTKRG